MRRPTHPMRIGPIALGVVLFIATAAMWARSYVTCDQYIWGTSQRWVSLWSARGGVTLGSFASPGSNGRPQILGYQFNDPGLADALYAPGNGDPGVRHDARLLGFRARVSDGGRLVLPSTAPGVTATMTFTWRPGLLIRVPLWSLCALALLPILTPLIARRRRRLRARRHVCTACDYDLTGNVSGVCPECGTTIARDEPATP